MYIYDANWYTQISVGNVICDWAVDLYSSQYILWQFFNVKRKVLNILERCLLEYVCNEVRSLDCQMGNVLQN